jgi:transposase-like protein
LQKRLLSDLQRRPKISDSFRNGKPLTELAQQFDVPPNQITDWKNRLQNNAASPFGDHLSSTMASPMQELAKLSDDFFLANDRKVSADQTGRRSETSWTQPMRVISRTVIESRITSQGITRA